LESDWRTLISQSELHVEPALPDPAENKNQNLSLFWPTDLSVSCGDGSAASNHTSGSNATHDYDETDAQFDDTCAPATLNATADTVERVAHGYVDGDEVVLYDVATTTGVVAGERYFVVNKTANDFQVSRTAGGAALAMTSDGTANLLPYKQVAITITPQAAQNLTSFNINAMPAGVGDYASLPWLEVIASMPSCTSITAFGASYLLERVNFLSLGAVTTLSNLFTSCHAVEKIDFPSAWGTSVTNTSGLFSNCHHLVEVGLFTVTSVTNTANMFAFCYRLPRLPDFVFSGTITNSSGMFKECWALQTLANVTVNVASVTDGSYMFAYCTSMTAAPTTLSFSSATTVTYLFYLCSRLTSLGTLSITGAANADNAFQNTSSLERISSLNLSGITSLASGFSGSGVRELPTLDLGGITGSLANAFNSTRALQKLVISDIGLPTSMASFARDSEIESCEIQGGSFASLTTLATAFSICSRLHTVVMPSDTDATLTSAVQMFTESVQLVNVPYFYTGAVTSAGGMFSYCYSLKSIPQYDFGAVTDASNLFVACRNLLSIPALNLAAATNCSGTFQQCGRLMELPAISFTSATNLSNLFANSASLMRILATDLEISFSIQSCALGVTALNELYTNLPTVVGQTITVTGNPGTSGDDPTIATAKGWTVTG
jgi:hypothetical protein